MRWLPLFLCLLLTSSLIAEDAPARSLEELLGDFGGTWHLLFPPPQDLLFTRATSADPQGLFPVGKFRRVEAGGERVLLDLRGSGVLTRLWMPEGLGVVRITWDGAPEPQIALRWDELFARETPPLMPPFTQRRWGGGALRFPVPFRESLRVTLAGPGDAAYQADAYLFGGGGVEGTLSEADDAAARAAYQGAFEAWADPASLEVAGRRRTVIAPVGLDRGEGAEWVAEEAATVTELRLALSPADADWSALEVSLPVAEGGRASVPADLLFGVAGPEAGATLLQGRGEEGGEAYFRVPFTMPPGSALSLRNTGGRAVRATLRVTLASPQPEEPPFLAVSYSADRVGLRRTFVPPPLRWRGRLLAVALDLRGEVASALAGHEWLMVDGEEGLDPDRGTTLADGFDAPPQLLPDAPFAGPLTAVTGVQVDRATGAVRRAMLRQTFWPYGVPFRSELAYRIRSGAQATDYRVLLIGQQFGEAEEIPVAGVGLWSDLPQGARVAERSEGEWVLAEAAPPVALVAEEPELRLRAEAPFVEGSVRIEGDSQGQTPTLEVPTGWRGEWLGGGRFRIVPPEVLEQGTHVITVRLGDAARPFLVVHEARGGEPVAQWLEDAQGTTVTLTAATMPLRLPLPGGFEPQPGDTLRFRVETAAREAIPLQVTWHAEGDRNAAGYPEGLAGALPGDGSAPALLLAEVNGVQTQEVVLGRFASWLGPRNRELALSAALPENGSLTLRGPVGLYRAAEVAETSGTLRLLAMADGNLQGFVLPPARLSLSGAALYEGLSRVNGGGGDWPRLEQFPEMHLANLRHGALRPSVLAEQEVAFPDKASVAVGWRNGLPGTRFRLEHDGLVGARRVALRFAYGPLAGRVLVRDGAGRPLVVVNLFATEPMLPGLLADVTLPEPNPQGALELEVLDAPPGSLGYQGWLERVLVLQ